ncbi:T-cell surface glycoprotein CD5 [Mycteria americana]|uniref:T-cell surface glycoprotein CD5 n=1 Tax=Mycteria americana TaxID=33587 RepID=UPI003F58D39D
MAARLLALRLLLLPGMWGEYVGGLGAAEGWGVPGPRPLYQSAPAVPAAPVPGVPVGTQPRRGPGPLKSHALGGPRDAGHSPGGSLRVPGGSQPSLHPRSPPAPALPSRPLTRVARRAAAGTVPLRLAAVMVAPSAAARLYLPIAAIPGPGGATPSPRGEHAWGPRRGDRAVGTAPWGRRRDFVSGSSAAASLAWRLLELPRPGSRLRRTVGFLQPGPLAQPHGTPASRAPHLPVHPPTLQPSLQLTGSGCRCAGMLEAKWKGRWSRVCRDSVSEAGADNICRWLGCGPPIAKPLEPVFTGGKEPHAWLLRCLRPAATPLGCHWVPGNCTEHAVLACSEPVQTTPEPPPAPPTTSPEPTGPPRLRLVDGNFSCSGFVELHRQGLWGAVAGSQGIWPKLATRICQDLSCGTAIDSRSHAKPERGSHLPVRWEAVESCESRPLLDCFNRTSARWGKAPAFVLCSGSQPQALWRLVAGPTPCEGDVEVFHQGQWQVLCDNRAQRAKRGRQLCQQLRCGNLSSSTEVRDPPSTGVTCEVPTLHLCPASLGTPRTCSRTRVVCQDSKPHPAGVAAGTVVSICLALLLFGILSLICGPPAYRRLMKRISKKKQRQWIGPTGLNQTVSFHRNSTVTLRPRAEGQRAQGGDNDYAQPPQKSSYLSAYPALEGACRASNPPDNSSDSDYDLHSARRV